MTSINAENNGAPETPLLPPGDVEKVIARLRGFRSINEWGDPCHHTELDAIADQFTSLLTTSTEENKRLAREVERLNAKANTWIKQAGENAAAADATAEENKRLRADHLAKIRHLEHRVDEEAFRAEQAEAALTASQSQTEAMTAEIERLREGPMEALYDRAIAAEAQAEAMKAALEEAKERLETQMWWHEPDHSLYPLRFIIEDACALSLIKGGESNGR